MADFLVTMGERPWVRKTVSSLGIPLPMPQALARGEGPWTTAFLAGKPVLRGGQDDKVVARTLEEAGAGVAGGEDKVYGLVYDLRAATAIADLDGMYRFFHENIRRLGTNGRIVVIARSADPDADAQTAAAAAAVTGFVKSVAKEVGKKGATANAIFAAAGAEENVAGPLRFFLSARSAFVDGQSMTVAATPQRKAATPWQKPLAGKTALVTGAARGIGEITARRLAEEGAQVIVLDIPQAAEDVKRLAAEINGVPLTLDITAAEAVKTILDTAAQHGGLQIVVNNAGVTRDKTLANMDADRWRLAIGVNLQAALAITEGALAGLNEDGRVICLSSIAGIAGNFGQTNYGAAKAGLIGAVRHLAPRFAAKGATINAVAPGFIETQMTAAIPLITREAGRRLSNLGQGGLPVDVAELITFLVSPGATGVNGQVIRVCGGNYLGA